MALEKGNLVSKSSLKLIFLFLVIFLIFFSFRLYNSYHALFEKAVTGRVDYGSLRGWMTVSYAAHLFDADLDCVCSSLNVSLDVCKKMSIREVGELRGHSNIESLAGDLSPFFRDCKVRVE